MVCYWALSSAVFWVQLASRNRDGGEGRILCWHLLEPAPSLGLGGLGNKNALLVSGQEASCVICLFLKGSRVSGRVELRVKPHPRKQHHSRDFICRIHVNPTEGDPSAQAAASLLLLCCLNNYPAKRPDVLHSMP